MTIENVGAICFGLVIGWITYRTLRRSTGTAISDLAAVIAAVGGGAVTLLFDTKIPFAYYSIGLAAGFFLYFIIAMLYNKENVDSWMSDK